MPGPALERKDRGDRLREIISDVLGVSPAEITDESSPGSVPQWDSVNHLNIVMAVENEFGITIPSDTALEMLNVAAIRKVLTQQGISA